MTISGPPAFAFGVTSSSQVFAEHLMEKVAPMSRRTSEQEAPSHSMLAGYTRSETKHCFSVWGGETCQFAIGV